MTRSDCIESTGHRVIIEFDDGVGATLICPESGCTPATVCVCGRQYDEPGEGCYDCRDRTSDECWVKTWFDNLMATELLHGKIEVAIDPEWMGDHMRANVVAPVAVGSGQEGAR